MKNTKYDDNELFLFIFFVVIIIIVDIIAFYVTYLKK